MGSPKTSNRSDRTSGKAKGRTPAPRQRRAEPSRPSARCDACDAEQTFRSWGHLIRAVLEDAAVPCPGCGRNIEVLSVVAEPAELERLLSRIDRARPAPGDGVSRDVPDVFSLRAWSQWRG